MSDVPRSHRNKNFNLDIPDSAHNETEDVFVIVRVSGVSARAVTMIVPKESDATSHEFYVRNIMPALHQLKPGK